MTIEFDDILAAICSRVKPTHANDFQKIYILESSIEAKLAFDILVSYGFDAKVYHTPDKPSKLYITTPKQPPEQLQEAMSAALAYAQALKQIVASLDNLCSSDATSHNAYAYTMTFANCHAGGKQILIQITPHASAHEQAFAHDAPPQYSTAAPPATVTASQPRTMRKVRKPKNNNDFASGPTVGRGLYPAQILPEGGNKKESLRRRLMLRIFGNFATSGYAALAWLVLVFVLFTCFVFAKSFLCYDFVAKKSNKWYCKDPSAVSEQELRKQQIEERQKQLGLQPVDTQQ